MLRDCILDIITFIVLIVFVIACLFTNWFWFDETPPWRTEKQVQSEQPNIEWPTQIIVEKDIVYGNCPEITITPQQMIDTEQLEMLAKIIDAECGDDWCTDELQLYVGSVVLNRIVSEEFPNTMKEVLNQKGQYGGEKHWKNNGRTPSERTYENARKLLTNGSVLPLDIVFQANFKQGSGVYAEIQGVYFCHR